MKSKSAKWNKYFLSDFAHLTDSAPSNYTNIIVSQEYKKVYHSLVGGICTQWGAVAVNFYQIKIDKPRWKGVIENLSKTTVNIRGISIPYKDFQSQKERLNGKAGIYFFIWIDGETGNIQKCYIGETENLALRPLQKHGSIKLDWHYVTVFFRDHDIERHFDTDTRQYIEQTLIDQFPYPKILINGNGGHKSKKKMLP